MNKLILATVVSLFFCGSLAFAAEEHHPGSKGAPTEDAAKQARMMQEHMIKMHEQMHKIMDAKDPKERERLMQEQQKTMQEHMKQMHGGMGGMMGPGKMGGEGKGAMQKPGDK